MLYSSVRELFLFIGFTSGPDSFSYWLFPTADLLWMFYEWIFTDVYITATVNTLTLIEHTN